MTHVISELCEMKIENNSFDWVRSSAPQTSISSRESNLLNYAALSKHLPERAENLIHGLIHKKDGETIVEIPFARLDHNNTLKIADGKFTSTTHNATDLDKTRLHRGRIPEENKNLGLTSYANHYCDRHVQRLINIHKLFERCKNEEQPDWDFHKDFTNILSSREKDVFRVVDYVVFTLYELIEVHSRVTEPNILSGHKNITPVFIQELIACSKTLIEKLEDLLTEASANNSILMKEIRNDFYVDLDIPHDIFDSAVSIYNEDEDNDIADVSINETARVRFAEILCRRIQRDPKWEERFSYMPATPNKTAMTAFYDSNHRRVSGINTGLAVPARLAQCIIFKLRNTNLTYNTKALNKPTMYYTILGIDGALLKNDYDMIEEHVSLDSDGLDRLSSTTYSPNRREQRERSNLRKTIKTRKEIHNRLEFRKTLHYCINKLNDAYNNVTKYLKYDGMLHFSENTSILSKNRITSVLLPPKDITPRPFQRKYLEQLFVRMKNNYDIFNKTGSSSTYEFKYDDMMKRLSLLDHSEEPFFADLVEYLEGDSEFLQSFRKYIEHMYTFIMAVRELQKKNYIKLIAQFIFNLRSPVEDEEDGYKYMKSLRNKIPNEYYNKSTLTVVIDKARKHITPSAAVSKIADNVPPIEIYYIASVANSGKTTLAIMAAKLVELFKRAYTNSPNFEIVFCCTNGLVRDNVYAEAIRSNINVAKISDKAQVTAGSTSEVGNTGLKSESRSLAIMSPLMLIPYRTNNISEDHSVALGNFDAFVIIDEYCANIGTPEAASELEEVDSYGNISSILKKYAIETLFTNRASSLFTVMGATMVPSENIQSAVTRSRKTKDEDCVVHTEMDGEIHVGVDTQLYDGRPVNMWSMGPRSQIRYFFSSFLQPLYKRMMTHTTSNFLKEEIDNCLSLREFRKEANLVLAKYELGDIDTNNIEEKITNVLDSRPNNKPDLYNIWECISQYGLESVRSARDYGRLNALNPYLESNLDNYTGNSIANYACGLVSYVVQCGSNYINRSTNDVTAKDMKDYWLKIESVKSEIADLPIPKETPFPKMNIPKAADLNAPSALTMPLGDEYYDNFEMYDKYFPMSRSKTYFADVLFKEYDERISELNDKGTKATKNIVLSGTPEDTVYRLLGKILNCGTDNLSEIKTKVNRHIAAQVKEHEADKKRNNGRNVQTTETFYEEDARTGRTSTKHAVVDARDGGSSMRASGVGGYKRRPFDDSEKTHRARPTDLHKYAYMFGISLITEEDAGDINLIVSSINIGDRRLAFSHNIDGVTRILFDPSAKIYFSPYMFLQGQARAGRVGLSDSATSIMDDETGFRMFVSAKSARINNFFLAMKKICSNPRYFDQIFDNDINVRSEKRADPKLTTSIESLKVKIPDATMDVFVEAIFYDEINTLEYIVRKYPSIVNEPYRYSGTRAEIICRYADKPKKKRVRALLQDKEGNLKPYNNCLEFASAAGSTSALKYLEMAKDYMDKYRTIELVTWAIKRASIEIGMIGSELVEYFVGSAANGFEDPSGVASSLGMKKFDADNLIKLLDHLSYRYSLAHDIHNYETYTDILNTRIDDRSTVIADRLTPDVTETIRGILDVVSPRKKMSKKEKTIATKKIKNDKSVAVTGEAMADKNKVNREHTHAYQNKTNKATVHMGIAQYNAQKNNAQKK
jgi:hypothetical protein